MSERCDNGTESITADHDHHETRGVQSKHPEDNDDDDDGNDDYDDDVDDQPDADHDATHKVS